MFKCYFIEKTFHLFIYIYYIDTKVEEELMDELMLLFVAEREIRYSVPFRLHSVPKSKYFLDNILPLQDEKRFKQMVRVSRLNFIYIYDLIKDHEVFNGSRSCRQLPVSKQLMIVLYRLGCSGEGGSITKIANLFGIGDGGTLQVSSKGLLD